MLRYLSARDRLRFVTVGTPENIAKMETLVLEKYNRWTGIYIDSDLWKIRALELFTNQKLIHERISFGKDRTKSLTSCLKTLDINRPELLNIYSRRPKEILDGIDFTQIGFSYVVLHSPAVSGRKDYFQENNFLQITASDHLQIYFNINLSLKGEIKRS